MDPHRTDTTIPHSIRVEVDGGDTACEAPDGVRFERLTTHPAPLRRLTGYRAIEAADRWQGAITLSSYATPDGEAEDDIPADRARELAAADPGLVYAVADLLFGQSELETWASCGPLRVLLTTPSSLSTDWPAVTPGEGLPPGVDVVAPAVLGAGFGELADQAADALAARLAELLEEAG